MRNREIFEPDTKMENYYGSSRQRRHIRSISGFRDESGPGNSSAKELTAQLMEMTRMQQVAAVQRQKQAAQKKKDPPKPPVNPLKFP